MNTTETIPESSTKEATSHDSSRETPDMSQETSQNKQETEEDRDQGQTLPENPNSPRQDTTKMPGSHANWGSFFPPLSKSFPISLESRVKEHFSELEQRLVVKELLLAKVDKIFISRTNDMWVGEANQIFRSLVRTKNRLRKLSTHQTGTTPKPD